MQVNCQFGRENFDSWGRKKRDVWKRDAHQEYDENVQVIEEQEDSQHMRLSHEIIVLDYGDERSSPYEQEKKVDKTLRKGNSKLFLFVYISDSQRPVCGPCFRFI